MCHHSRPGSKSVFLYQTRCLFSYHDWQILLTSTGLGENIPYYMSKEIRLLTALGFKDIYSCTLQEVSFNTEENCSANRGRAAADVTSQKTTRPGASMKQAFVASAWLSRPGTQRCSVVLRTPGRIQVFRVALSWVGSPRTAHTWTVLDLLTCDCLWQVMCHVCA